MWQHQCVNVYCWQMHLCDISFYVTQLVKEVGLLRLMLEKLSHLCCTSSCNTFVSKSSWFSPRCVIAWLLELNEGSFHLLLLPTSPWVLLLSHWLAISVDFHLRELLWSHLQPSTVAGLAFICSKKLLSAWSLVETLVENLPLQEALERHSASFDEFHRKTVEKKRGGKGSRGWQEAEIGKMWEYRWGAWSGRKERAGRNCGLSRVGFSWMWGWRQMRSTNAVFSVYKRSLIRCETIYHGLEGLASLLRELTFLDTVQSLTLDSGGFHRTTWQMSISCRENISFHPLSQDHV